MIYIPTSAGVRAGESATQLAPPIGERWALCRWGGGAPLECRGPAHHSSLLLLLAGCRQRRSGGVPNAPAAPPEKTHEDRPGRIRAGGGSG